METNPRTSLKLLNKELHDYFTQVLKMPYSGFDEAALLSHSGYNYTTLLQLLDLIICVIIKSETNEDFKEELIQHILSLSDSTQELLQAVIQRAIDGAQEE